MTDSGDLLDLVNLTSPGSLEDAAATRLGLVDPWQLRRCGMMPPLGSRASNTAAPESQNDVEAITSGNPKRVERRLKNKLIGRLLGTAGIWRRLWR